MKPEAWPFARNATARKALQSEMAERTYLSGNTDETRGRADSQHNHEMPSERRL